MSKKISAVRSNHIRCACKSPVASCVYMAMVRKHVFNAFVSSTKVFVFITMQTHSSPAKNVFVSSTMKSIRKSSCYLGMGLKKGTKQGRNERKEKKITTSAVYFFQMSCSLLAFFFHFCLVYVPFSIRSLNEMKFYESISLLAY